MTRTFVDDVREWKRLMRKIKNAKEIGAFDVANRTEIAICFLEDKMDPEDLNRAGREFMREEKETRERAQAIACAAMCRERSACSGCDLQHLCEDERAIHRDPDPTISENDVLEIVRRARDYTRAYAEQYDTADLETMDAIFDTQIVELLRERTR